MFDENENETEVAEVEAEKTEETEEAAEPVIEEPRIMCYVSKEMVPMSQTVEVEYESGKTFRVMPKYLKYAQTAAE